MNKELPDDISNAISEWFSDPSKKEYSITHFWEREQTYFICVQYGNIMFYMRAWYGMWERVNVVQLSQDKSVELYEVK